MLRNWTLTVALVAAPAGAACDALALGAGVELSEDTPVAAVLAAPEEYLGRRIAIRGDVTDVCEMAGCWLELEAGEGGKRFRVKVDDGVIVFPKWSRGHAARAEGTVERLELAKADYILYREHEAHESGGEFDESTVEGEGPFSVYRLRGTGAEICR